MRLIDKSDTSLAIALVTGTLVMFERPLRLLLETARAVEVRYDIDLIPGLAVLVSAFAFHQYRKREQARLAAQAANSEIALARERAAELERLVAFGTALSAATDTKGLRQVFWRFMPAFARDREVWMLTRNDDLWEAVVRDITVPGARTRASLEQAAASALEWPAQHVARADGVLIDGDVCFPMAVGDRALGVVAVRNAPPIHEAERRALGAAIALLTTALRNVQLLTQTRENSVRDALTGCFNRAYAIETLTSEMHRARRTARPLSIMMFDVDRFKHANDQFGHLAGDAILAAVAGQCARTLRASDIKCRWGGDEFLIVLPDTPLGGAEQAGSSLTRDIAALRVPTRAGIADPTISVGVAVYEAADEDPMSLIARADEALYRAKGAGRNRFVVAPSLMRAAG